MSIKKNTAVILLAAFSIMNSQDVISKENIEVTALSDTKESFIVKTNDSNKKISRRNAKEQIGDNIKDFLHNCVKFNKNVGKLQQEICVIEKQMFNKVERLVDNRVPFKNASKANLKEALQIMNNINNDMISYIDSFKKIREQVNKNYCLKQPKK